MTEDLIVSEDGYIEENNIEISDIGLSNEEGLNPVDKDKIVSKSVNMEAAIEAILFTMGESVEAGTIAKALELPKQEVLAILRAMMECYEEEDRGVKIIELDEAFQMCTKNEYYEYLIRIAKQPKQHVLTDVLLETLSIIAYKQPITRLEIEKVRGVSSDHAVNKLLEYNLIRELGRLDAPGRPLLFGTSEEFLRSVGLQSTDELPVLTPDENIEGQMSLELEV